jgi:hypothetical protein
MIRFVLPFTLFACATEAPEETLLWSSNPSAEMAAPVDEGAVTLTNLAPGHHALMEVTGLYPDERVAFIHGQREGDGACLSFLGDDCFDIEGPYRNAGLTTVGADGTAELVIELPDTIGDGFDGAVQAVVWDGSAGRLLGAVAYVSVEPALGLAAGQWLDNYETSHHVNRRTWHQSGTDFYGEPSSSTYHIVETLPTVGNTTPVLVQNDLSNTYSPGLWSRFDLVEYVGDPNVYMCQQVYNATSAEAARTAPLADDTDATKGGCGTAPYLFAFSVLTPVGMDIAGDYSDPAYGGSISISETEWVSSSEYAGVVYSSIYDVVDWWSEGDLTTLIAQNADDASYHPGLWTRLDVLSSGDDLYYCQTAYSAPSEASAAMVDASDASAPSEGGCGSYGFPWTRLVTD